MADETEQKILDAALKIFSEKGYKGATTLIIAEKAGFSEKTLFRKFKTKENLFNRVILKNNEKIKDDFGLLLLDKKLETPEDFLETLIKNLAKLTDDNYEYLSITLNEYSRVSEIPAAQEIAYYLGEYIEKNIPNKEINYQIFAVTILSYIYLLIGDKYHERTFTNYEDAIEGFIKNSAICVR